MFALCAVFMGMAAYLNSRMVERLGMRRISHAALLAYIVIAVLHTVVAATGLERISTFVLFQSAGMAAFGLSVSNFGAMAMEPVGAVAGVGASLQGFVSTFLGALVGAFIGRQFNGTTVPLAAGGIGCGLAALGCVLLAEKGRLFSSQHGSEGGMLNAQTEGAGLH
jgi:DHA1 family bicyclomycin/chloramphenicol resistance-like MFS transporter